MTKINDVYRNQLYKSINTWGKQTKIYYGDTAECNSCSWDPINRESTNVACSTCNGQYYYKTQDWFCARGVLKSFIGDMKQKDYFLNKYGYVPEFDARLTYWLEDVLINTDSATGYSYLDSDKLEYVEVAGKKYDVIGTYRTGVDDISIIVATLKEIK